MWEESPIVDPVMIMMAVETGERRTKARAEVTQYSHDDLDDGWEFKVVRGRPDGFRSAPALQALLDQESRSGWIMLEKLDNSRVRFKRQASARKQDASLPAGVDPYRTDLIPPPLWWAALLVIAVLGGAALILAGFAGR